MHIVTLKQHYNDLCEQLNQLQYLLTKQPAHYATAAYIQPLTKKQEHEPLTLIEPVTYTDSDAVELAMKAYKDLHTVVGFSQKSARRTPGVIWFDTRDTHKTAEIVDCITAINTSKMAIKDYVVSNFNGASARFEVLKQACPGVMTVHLYRLIRCYHAQGIRSVRFTWAQQQALVYPDKDKLAHKIQQAIEQSSNADYIANMTTLLKLISEAPYGRIRIRRQVKVQPVANITQYNGAAGPVTAPLPIIILQDQQPIVKSIGDFSADVAAQRKKRSDTLDTVVLGVFQGETIELVAARD